MVKYIQQGGYTGKTMVAITSGANMDFDRYVCKILLFVCVSCVCICVRFLPSHDNSVPSMIRSYMHT